MFLCVSSFKPLSTYGNDIIIKKGETVKWKNDNELKGSQKLIVRGNLIMKDKKLTLKDKSSIIVEPGGSFKAKEVYFEDNSEGKFHDKSKVEIGKFFSKSKETCLVNTQVFIAKEEFKIDKGTNIDGYGRIVVKGGRDKFMPENGSNIKVCVGSSTRNIDCDYNKRTTNLPIELTDFSVKIDNESVHLTWETAQEINNSHYIIEYSSDGVNFHILEQSIQGAGNSNTSQFYEIDHIKPNQEKLIYRLTQVDFDGKSTSWLREVYNEHNSNNTSEVLKVYPNPAQYELNILLSLLPDAETTFELININSGKHIIDQPHYNPTESKAVYNVKDLPAGTYILHVKDRNKVIYNGKVVVLNNRSRVNEEVTDDHENKD